MGKDAALIETLNLFKKSFGPVSDPENMKGASFEAPCMT